MLVADCPLWVGGQIVPLPWVIGHPIAVPAAVMPLPESAGKLTILVNRRKYREAIPYLKCKVLMNISNFVASCSDSVVYRKDDVDTLRD